jgi:hypothetical protein
MQHGPPVTLPPRLFKYVTPARAEILESLTIRFTQPYGLNDVFELTPVFAAMGTKVDIRHSHDTTWPQMRQEAIKAWERRSLAPTPRDIAQGDFIETLRVSCAFHVVFAADAPWAVPMLDKGVKAALARTAVDLGGRAVSVFEGNPSPSWNPVPWRPGQ